MINMFIASGSVHSRISSFTYIGSQFSIFHTNIFLFYPQKQIHEADLSKSVTVGEPFNVIVVNAQLQCEFCDFVFSDVAALFEHEAAHDPSRGYQCMKCSITVSELREIVVHWQFECTFVTIDKSGQINLRTYFVCNVCGGKFTNVQELYDHRYGKLHFFPRRRHATDTIELNCEKCGALHTKTESLIQHQEQMHPKKQRKYSAQGNGTTATSSTGTTASTKYRQYLCDVCGKSYTQSSHLWQHLRFHKGKKNYEI